MEYSNPRTRAVIPNWPLGGSRRGDAVFAVEQHPTRGERATRTTTGKPKATTYARKVRIVDGDDGRTYIICLTDYGHIGVFQSNMQYSQEAIFERDPRYSATLALFNEE